MVHGLIKFKEYFQNHTNQYVLIGGAACDILLDDLGVPYRATRDLDIVLIVEALDPSFGQKFWSFILDGGYKHRVKGTGGSQFYRFSEPVDPAFPQMIELFSKRPENIELAADSRLTPIHVDDSIISLSAILLNDHYYRSLVEGKRDIQGYSVLSIEFVILFKIRAWLDLKEREKSGEHIDMKTIKKHKNDIFRLLVNVIPTSRTEVADEIRRDVVRFVSMIHEDRPHLIDLGITSPGLEELLDMMNEIYISKNDQ